MASLLILWLSSKGTPSDQTANIIRFLRKHNLSIWLDIIKLQKHFGQTSPLTTLQTFGLIWFKGFVS